MGYEIKIDRVTDFTLLYAICSLKEKCIDFREIDPNLHEDPNSSSPKEYWALFYQNELNNFLKKLGAISEIDGKLFYEIGFKSRFIRKSYDPDDYQSFQEYERGEDSPEVYYQTGWRKIDLVNLYFKISYGISDKFPSTEEKFRAEDIEHKIHGVGVITHP